MDWLELIISFVITWGVGLSPALIARYKIYGRPIKPSTSTWIAAISCFIFFWVFRILVALSEPETQSTGVVWVLVFFVSRAIMSRGYNKQLVQRIEKRLGEENLPPDDQEKLENALQRLKK